MKRVNEVLGLPPGGGLSGGARVGGEKKKRKRGGKKATARFTQKQRAFWRKKRGTGEGKVKSTVPRFT